MTVQRDNELQDQMREAIGGLSKTVDEQKAKIAKQDRVINALKLAGNRFEDAMATNAINYNRALEQITLLEKALELMAGYDSTKDDCSKWDEFCNEENCTKCWIDHYKAEAKKELEGE